MLPHLRSGDTIFDIGANIGFVSMMLAAKLGRDCKIYAFETNPENVSILLENLRRNDMLKCIFPICAAVGGRPGIRISGMNKLNINTMDMGWQLNRPVSDYSVHLPVVTLDMISIAPDVVKLDIDGGEDEVIEASSDIMSSARVLNIEYRKDSQKAKEFCENLLLTHENIYERRHFTPGGDLDFTEIVFIKKAHKL